MVGRAPGWHEVHAGGGVGRIHVTPPGSGAIHRLAVAVHHTRRVDKGEGGALAATVDMG